MSVIHQEETDPRMLKADVDHILFKEAIACVPDGYEIVLEGKTKEGDIAYGGRWGLDHPYTRPKYDQVLDCGIGHFFAIARKRETA